MHPKRILPTFSCSRGPASGWHAAFSCSRGPGFAWHLAFTNVVTVGLLAIGLAGTTGCYAEVGGDPAYYPSDSIIATEDPVYYDGNPTYFYGGYWYYRGSGGRWNYYRSEPAYLRQYRGAHPGAAQRGVRGGVRAAPRGGGRSGGGRRR